MNIVSNITTESEVLVFHDETGKVGKEKFNGHILLFVPQKLYIIQKGTIWGDKKYEVNSFLKITNKIERIREQYAAYHKFHFKTISGGKWTKYNEAEKQLIIAGIDALRSKGVQFFQGSLYCKFAVIFFPTPLPDDLALYGGNSKDEKILRFNETILRMLLKGAVHRLYDRNNKVKILKIISDGEPYHRKLSEERILLRLVEEQLTGRLREYVDIPLDAEIIHLNSDHKKYPRGSKEYAYANILQLADMFLGAVIQSCIKGIKWQNLSPKVGGRVEDKKSIIAYPIKEMLDKRKRGKNFEYSGHYKSFAISKAYIKDGKWEFANVTSKEIVIDTTGQITLFDFREEKNETC